MVPDPGDGLRAAGRDGLPGHRRGGGPDHVADPADERDRRYTTDVVHQILLTVLGATAGVMAVQLLGTGGGPAVTATVTLFQLLGYNLLVISAILVLRVLVGIFRRAD